MRRPKPFTVYQPTPGQNFPKFLLFTLGLAQGNLVVGDGVNFPINLGDHLVLEPETDQARRIDGLDKSKRGLVAANQRLQRRHREADRLTVFYGAIHVGNTALGTLRNKIAKFLFRLARWIR